MNIVQLIHPKNQQIFLIENYRKWGYYDGN